MLEEHVTSSCPEKGEGPGEGTSSKKTASRDTSPGLGSRTGLSCPSEHVEAQGGRGGRLVKGVDRQTEEIDRQTGGGKEQAGGGDG